MPEFKGIKITQDTRARDEYGINWVYCDRRAEHLVLDRPGVIGWGGNSGFHAVNIAVQCGAKRIILIGYDMTLDGGIHWHGEHKKPMTNPTKHNVLRWRNTMDSIAPTLIQLGIKVYNCSPVSALRNYPKVTLEDALNDALA